MLKYYDDVKEIRDVGSRRRDDFNYWRHLLADTDTNAAYVEDKIAEAGWTRECWFCSSFVPGPDWRGTPYQPIYDAMYERYGAEPAWNQSRLFFGLLVKDVIVHRPEHWLCYKVPEEELEKGTNYFPDFSAE
ncbi:MAG TPA: hypothetical protein VGU90_03990 [Terriglobales bacterium]|nr:hypothetical protein [Terriglobales bacterium]